MVELTLEQATKHPFNFIYLWADENAFLRKINPEYARKIRQKKANQNLLIYHSAQKYKISEENYKKAIRLAFIAAYGCTPAEALIKMAMGETVQGKDFQELLAEQMSGIGSLRSDFKGEGITVDPKNGYAQKNGQNMVVYDVVWADVNGESIPLQKIFYDETTGKTYVSQYNKVTKKYYAQGWSDEEGNMFKANGTTAGSSDMGSTWETALLTIDAVGGWIESILKALPVSTEPISVGNTLPNQTKDGFVYKSGMSEAGMIALALVAGGALLMGAPGERKNKK